MISANTADGVIGFRSQQPPRLCEYRGPGRLYNSARVRLVLEGHPRMSAGTRLAVGQRARLCCNQVEIAFRLEHQLHTTVVYHQLV
jgi:hypothetical protein